MMIDIALGFAAVAVLAFFGYATTSTNRKKFTALGAAAGVAFAAVIMVTGANDRAEDRAFVEAVADLGEQYGVSIDEYPSNPLVPNEWKIDGEVRNCKATGLPHYLATDEERDATPALMCAPDNGAVELVPVDEVGDMKVPGVRH